MTDPNYWPTLWSDAFPVWPSVPTGVAVVAGAVHTQDHILRVQTTNATISVSGVPTASFTKAIRHAVDTHSFFLYSTCNSLGKVIDRMKDREEYNNFYREYLLGNLSEEDFEKVADKYAYTPCVANLVQLSGQIHALLAYTTHEFTKDEVADLFQVRDEDVDKVMSAQLPLFGILETPDSP
jgi:hypothetical protein